MGSAAVYCVIVSLLVASIPHEAYGNLGRLYTLAWCVVGVVLEKCVSLTVWATVTRGRARYAASRYRRLHRWIHNDKVEPQKLYGPLVRAALAQWHHIQVDIALDTSVLWDKFVLIRASLIYRGRAIPLAWIVIEHASARVSFADYAPVLYCVARLLPSDWSVRLLADRGFCDVELILALKKLGWHYRIRAKRSLLVYRKGSRKGCKIERLLPAVGQARFVHAVYLTRHQIGPVHLALAWPAPGQKEPDPWIIVSDELTNLSTFDEYGLRFDIEENFLDDKSGAFQVQESEIRSASGLSRLFLVLAITTLYLVSTGVEVTQANLRRSVDTHWDRGLSYLQIGWRWIRRRLALGSPLPCRLELSPDPDPEPSRASRRQHRPPPTLTVVADVC